RVTAPLRVHHLPDGGVTTGGDWSAAGLAAMACAALSPGADSVEELRALVGRLAAAEPDEVARAIPETLGAWLGAHTRSAEVREVRAPVAISTYPVWENFDLIDERLFPPDLAAAAWRLKAHRADLVGWQAGLRRLPAVRVTGHPDDHAGWNRLLAGPERVYRG